ncbi:MAG: Carbohydrate binding family 6 [Flavipsychrobacter sp.]|nr:Carbohydrate binding family 6 [Flavipsychrobacter sp.]
MRISLLTFLLVFIYLTGCSQSDNHDFHGRGKIPIYAKRWYQLNTPVQPIDELFDNKQCQKIDAGHGKVLDNYDLWYPILEGEHMTIDSIMMFDWEGSNADKPTTIYAILEDGKKVQLAVFTGMRYNGWNGPDPAKPDVYALSRSITNIRYLVINTWGFFPGELEFYGSYTPPAAITPVVKKSVPLSNYFGVNAFEWDFMNPSDILKLDPVRLNAIQSFTGVRHYLDWSKLEPKEGSYTFALTESGTWNYDTIYQWCRSQHIEVLACIKTVPDWMQGSTPKDQHGDENVPARFGKDLSDPASYIEQARMSFQFAARYGSNKNIDTRLIKVDTVFTPWPNGPRNIVRTGMNVVNYIECDNERDKWWQGRRAYQTGREYAANLSAFYDGNKNTMGPGIGVKNADPSMKVVMAGLADPNTDYVRGMIDWSIQHRGKKPDGSPDLPWDIINYHYYCNDADYIADKRQTTGRAPELTNAAKNAGDFMAVAHQFAHDMPVWVTETGYDVHQNSIQKAIPINKRSVLETQADWCLRTSLLYARSGIQKVFFYELMDDNPKSDTKFATSGLINANRSRRPVADYMYQVNKLFGKYTYDATIDNNPIVDRYNNNGKLMYIAFVPDEKGKTASCTIDLGSAATAWIYTPKTGSTQMNVVQQKTTGGKITITATETPVFVVGYEVK